MWRREGKREKKTSCGDNRGNEQEVSQVARAWEQGRGGLTHSKRDISKGKRQNCDAAWWSAIPSKSNTFPTHSARSPVAPTMSSICHVSRAAKMCRQATRHHKLDLKKRSSWWGNPSVMLTISLSIVAGYPVKAVSTVLTIVATVIRANIFFLFFFL